MTPEGKIKAKVDAVLKRHGVYYLKPVQMGMGKPGLDYHCIHHGHGFAIETKAEGKYPTPRQNRTIKDIQDAGGSAWVISNDPGVAGLDTWLTAIEGGNRDDQ
jgi:hypothetical protein